METLNCSQCGNVSPADATVCPKCGAAFGEAKPAKKKKPKKKSNLLVYVIVLLAVLSGIYYIVNRLSRPVPPPQGPANVISANLQDFFKELRESFRQVTVAKKYYLTALAQLEGTETAPAETLPATVQDRFSQASENAALALENFKMAEKKLKDMKTIGLAGPYKKCESEFYDANDKFIEASKLLTAQAKARMQGDEKKILAYPLTDAAAKFETGDRLMTGLMIGGCKGDFLKYVRALPPEDKGLIFIEYKNFFGEKFSTHESQLSLIIDYYPPGTESAPSNGTPAPH